MVTEQSFAVAVRIGDREISTEAVMRRLQRRRILGQELQEIAREEVVRQEAALAGIRVSDQELQAASNRLRFRLGLASAADTQRWLQRNGQSVLEFEAAIENDLLREKVIQQFIVPKIAECYSSHREDFRRVRMRQLVVARQDLARELLSQLSDEGKEFSQLAERHSLHESRTSGGALGILYRRQLPERIASSVFEAEQGSVVGPFSSPRGFTLILVEEVLPSVLDGETEALLRKELFDAWVDDRLKASGTSYPLLDSMQCS